jgi:F-type H+-transporting ATPase subunit b
MGVLVNGTTLAALLSFVVLVLLLRQVGWGRIMDIMVRRQQRIERALSEAAEARSQAEALKAQMEADLARARQEAQAVLERAEKTAAERAQEILQAAREAAERSRAQALEEIRAEREEALRSIRSEVADLALRIAERVVRAELEGPRQREVLERAVADLVEAP